MKLNNFVPRTLSGIVLILIFLGSILFGHYTTLALLMVIFVFSIWEIKRMFRIKGKIEFIIILLAGLSGLLISDLIIQKHFSSDWIFGYLVLFSTSIVIIFTFVKSISIKELVILISGKIWLSISLLSYYLLGWVGVHGEFEPRPLLFLIIMIWINDIGAYLVGSFFGKRPLFKRISPEKTLEGFAGGIILTAASGYFISTIIDNDEVFKWIILGLTVGIAATIGDLFESKIKREAGVKDSGKIIPGHGGMLDRFDSLFFTAPVFLLIYQFL